jgi:hypothetical protein
MNNKKVKNKNNKNNYTHYLNKKKKKIFLPLLVFILFVGSSLAYFSIFNTSSYEDENSKLVIDYLEEKYNLKPIYATTSSENDICYLVAVYFSPNKGIVLCLTKDKKFLSPYYYTRHSKDIYEDLEVINFNFNLPVNFKRDIELVNKTSLYDVYKIKSPVGNLTLNKYILISNKTIVMFAEKINR